MAKEKDKFIEQGVLRGYERAKVAELFDLIEYFAGYGFNKSHSAAYALVAYETAYLKANYRTEFMAGLLSTKATRTDDVVKYIQNCRELGLEVLGPDINQSELDFTITGPTPDPLRLRRHQGAWARRPWRRSWRPGPRRGDSRTSSTPSRPRTCRRPTGGCGSP